MSNNPNVTITIDDIRLTVAERLSNLDLTPFYRQVGKLLLTAEADNFLTEGAYFNRGTSWEPLAESTIRYRGSSDNILRPPKGGARLANSFTFEANSAGLEFGTNIFYGKYLHFGVPGKLPARPLFPDEFPPDLIEDIADAMERFLGTVKL